MGDIIFNIIWYPLCFILLLGVVLWAWIYTSYLSIKNIIINLINDK